MDDLLCTGLREDLMWMKKQLLKEYELEFKLMGGDDDMKKKAIYLRRTLEWNENGLGVRPDRRHVRALLRELGIETCRNMSTPLSVTTEKEEHRNERPEMSAELATNHRTAVARVVYLAQDRLDLGVAAVELAKTMAVPREGDNERLKRVARYLHGHPDYIQWYAVQDETNQIVLTTTLIGPLARNRDDQTQEALCSWEITSLLHGVEYNHALLLVQARPNCMLVCVELQKHWVSFT